MTDKPNVCVVSGRASFVKLTTPEVGDSGKKAYSLEIIVPKTETETLAAMKAAVLDAIRYTFGDKIPPTLKRPVKDGDVSNASATEIGAPERPEIAGAVHFTVRYYEQFEGDRPVCVSTERLGDGKFRPLRPGELVSGDYVRVKLRAAGFNRPDSKGVGLYLMGLQMTAKGEPLASGAESAEDMFGGYSTPGESAPADDWL